MINKVLHGDCLNQLKEIPNFSADMIYLDTPFYTQKTQTSKSKDNKEYS